MSSKLCSSPDWILSQHIADDDDVGAYDYGSIMHYPRNAFSVDGSDTITGEPDRRGGRGLAGRSGGRPCRQPTRRRLTPSAAGRCSGEGTGCARVVT